VHTKFMVENGRDRSEVWT